MLRGAKKFVYLHREITRQTDWEYQTRPDACFSMNKGLRQTTGSIEPTGRSPLAYLRPLPFGSGRLYCRGDGMEPNLFLDPIHLDVQIHPPPSNANLVILVFYAFLFLFVVVS